MIQLDRHSNPDFSVINISSFILQELIKDNQITYDKLLSKITYLIGEEAKLNYPYALNFLYLVGKIKYNQVNDSFEYVEL